MEHTNQRTISTRILEHTNNVTEEFALQYAAMEYKYRTASGESPGFSRPDDGISAAIYMRNVMTDEELDQRIANYNKLIHHEYDCLVVSCKVPPPKPSVIAPEIQVTRTKDPFPDIPASREIDLSRSTDPMMTDDQEFLISNIKNSYISNNRLALTTVGRGRYARQVWTVLPCKRPNTELFPKGKTPSSSENSPQFRCTQALVKRRQSILCQALMPELERLMRMDPNFQRMLPGTRRDTSQDPDEITFFCNSESCINLGHAKIESHARYIGRKRCLSGSLCNCPGESKCLSAGFFTFYASFFSFKLYKMQYACRAAAFITSIRRLSIGSDPRKSEVFGVKKNRCMILDEKCEAIDFIPETEDYRKFDEEVATRVSSVCKTFRLKIVEDMLTNNS